MLQNVTPIRKWAPWTPNMSDGDVFCTAPATRNSSLHFLFRRPTPAIVLTLTFGSLLLKCRILCACHEKWRLKIQQWSEHAVFLRYWHRNVLGTTAACTFQQLNSQKRSGAEVLLTLRLRNVLSTRVAYTFSTAQLPKALRPWGAFNVLTSKRAYFLDAHPAKRLRTHSSSQPAFRPSTKHWKNTVLRDFSTISHINFYLLLLHLSISRKFDF